MDGDMVCVVVFDVEGAGFANAVAEAVVVDGATGAAVVAGGSGVPDGVGEGTAEVDSGEGAKVVVEEGARDDGGGLRERVENGVAREPTTSVISAGHNVSLPASYLISFVYIDQIASSLFPLSRLIACPYPHYIIYPQADSPPSESRYIPRLPPLSIYHQDQKLPG
jgi:hypothetical protein